MQYFCLNFIDVVVSVYPTEHFMRKFIGKGIHKNKCYVSKLCVNFSKKKKHSFKKIYGEKIVFVTMFVHFVFAKNFTRGKNSCIYYVKKRLES